MRIVVFMLLFVSAEGARKDEPTLHEDHYDADGHHNTEYDTESVFGEDAVQFRNLDEEEAREKLSGYVDRMDINNDGNISHDELLKWIVISYRQIDRADTDKHFADQDVDADGKLKWPEVIKYTYGYKLDELEKLVAEKNMDALHVNQALPFDREKFQAADENKDESLSTDEFYNYVHPHDIPLLSDVETKRALAEFDKNNDGKIDFNEYLAETDKHADDPTHHHETEQANFAEFDKNKDGFLDFEETRLWMVPDYATVAKHEVDHLFTETDSDKNGLLSRAEILDQLEIFTGSHISREHDEL